MDSVLDIRRGGERFRTRTGWLDSKHSFSFGHHYDQRNTHFGLLLVSNDDVVQPGTGFETHPHRDMEIVTWVLEGALVHQDSTGHGGVIYPGLAQRMSAGTGILHSEKNDSWRVLGGPEHQNPVHFVQMWIVPDEERISPGYEQREIAGELLRGGLVPVASGMHKHRGHDGISAIRINQRHAALYAARLTAGTQAGASADMQGRAAQAGVELPVAPCAHLYVARGAVDLEGAGRLEAGDAVRITSSDGRRVTAASPQADVQTDAEILVWEMHASLPGTASQ